MWIAGELELELVETMVVGWKDGWDGWFGWCWWPKVLDDDLLRRMLVGGLVMANDCAGFR